jgi:hypothetical protein
MKQEAGWGAAAVIAIAAAVGISSRSTPAPQGSASTAGRAEATRTKSTGALKQVHNVCSDLVDLFDAFLLAKDIGMPEVCGVTGAKQAKLTDAGTFQPKFIIATLPDPLHTHFSLLFDRLVEAIQDGAQDEGYQYESSWLPWETEEPSLALLVDQDTEDDRKKNREDQPGVLLFRAPSRQPAGLPYQKGLIVFIVGEDPTDGIHRKQFENAVAWINFLHGGNIPVAILGPTFSGSFPSMAQLLSNIEVQPSGKTESKETGKPLEIYSGSVTSKGDAEQFAKSKFPKNQSVAFHSFLQDDDSALGRFCNYFIQQSNLDLRRLAVLSEDETAYGYAKPPSRLPRPPQTPQTSQPSQPCPGAPRLYYPRDISTLRAAYQKQSIFDSGSLQQNQGTTQRNSLATDLADPEGKEHDTVRSYAGNQKSLSQESQLLGIVRALRAHESQYVVILSSNTLDPLFLANFLRRDYPEARVVIMNSDLLFQRGQDALALSGVMTLSTYPLSQMARGWIASPSPTETLQDNSRVFPENSIEGTYIASRLLLHSPALRDVPESPGCSLWIDEKWTDEPKPTPPKAGQLDDPKEVFIPSIHCKTPKEAPYVPIPDYGPPAWTVSKPCSNGDGGDSCKPATWLSVITKTGYWPLAALNEYKFQPPAAPYTATRLLSSLVSNPIDHPDWAPLPLSMKLFLISLLIFAFFHWACCLFASFTAKPAFRAHFATPGWPHRVLILAGSFLVAVLALLAGWGCGIFSPTLDAPFNVGWASSAVLSVWIIAAFSIRTNILVVRKLNHGIANRQTCWTIVGFVIAFFFLIGVALYAWVYQLESALTISNRAFAYWRSMNLTSGVSPILPFLSLTMGLYIWFRCSLHGLALFGPDRPRLPGRENLILELKDPKDPSKSEKLEVLTMFSQEFAHPAERSAKPLAPEALLLSVVLFCLFWVVAAYVLDAVPVRSLGASKYAIIFCLSLDFCFSLILGATWQLWTTWSRLRQLLVFLDRMPLRRTMEALRGFSWGTVWKMSGNVLDVRYKLLSRQLEALNHLHTSLNDLIDGTPDLDTDELKSVDRCMEAVNTSRKAATNFAKWYSANFCKPNAAGLRAFKGFQKQIAATTGLLLSELLVPAWRKENHSLTLVEPDASDAGKNKQSSPESKEEYIRNAEEVTCLTYLGFVQNMLGRIRTMAFATLVLFVATTLAVSNYPFDPRPALSGVLLVLFLAFGAVIVFVYADMHRDATLSHITNTNPGELGSEFWIKIIGFGAAPLLGLITTVFPEMSGFLFSWLQPGLASLK